MNPNDQQVSNPQSSQPTVEPANNPSYSPVNPIQAGMSPVQNLNNAPPNVKKSKKWLYIIGGLVAFLIIIGVAVVVVLFNSLGNQLASSSKVANDYLSALENNNFSKAQSYESPSAQKSASALMLQAFWQKIGSPNSKYRITFQSIKDNYGEEYGIVDYAFANSAANIYLKIELINSSNKWQVLNISTTSNPNDNTLR